jgi:hypothetical protein
VHYSERHPDLRFTTFVIPQVPGTIRRSRPVRGVIESVFKAKKYELPLLALHPFVAGGVAAAYVADGRFNPAKDALVLGPDGNLEPPLSASERRAYSKGLAEVTRTRGDAEPGREEASWHRLLSNAQLELDSAGRPVLQVKFEDGLSSEVGITRDNVLSGAAPREIAQELLVARVREELRSGGAPKTSDAELRKDWKLLKSAFADPSQDLAARADARSHFARGGSD